MFNPDIISKRIKGYGLNEIYDSEGVKIKSINVDGDYTNMEIGEVLENIETLLNHEPKTKKYTNN